MSSKMLAIAVVASLSLAAVASAAPPCPPEVKEARDLLTTKITSAKAVQPAKPLAGARAQDVQTARGQDPQAPRGQDVQAPRNMAKGRATALANARRLVTEAETSCRDADEQRAAANARAAIELLKFLP